MKYGGERMVTRAVALKVRQVTFTGPYWTPENKAAALEGINRSEGAQRYHIHTAEVPSGGLPVYFVDGRSLKKTALNSASIRQASSTGFTVNGSFHPVEGIAINANHRNSPRSIRHIADHEADHWSGRKHISSRERRSLERISGGQLPEAMTWAPWPDEKR